MKQYTHHTITKAQRAVACLLLTCQLLTSCGESKTLGTPTLRQASSSTSTNPNSQSGGVQKGKGSSKGRVKGEGVSNPKASSKAKSQSEDLGEVRGEERGSSKGEGKEKRVGGPKDPAKAARPSGNSGVVTTIVACAAATPEEKSANTPPQSDGRRVWKPGEKSPEPKRDSESSASSSNIGHSQCTDCSPNSSQHRDYHEPVIEAVREFFETHFKRSPFLPQVDVSNITDHPHYELACIHDAKKITTEQTATQSGKSTPSSFVKSEENKLQGLNMVTAALTFFKVGGELHKKILIKCDNLPIKQAFDDDDRRKKDQWEKKEYHNQVIEDFNIYTANLLKNEPELLKQTITSKKQPRGKKGKQDITNPLLKENGRSYNDAINVYDIIKQEVINKLVAKGTIEGGRELTSEEERIIVKSIVSARKHAEEELSRYMRSPEFEAKLKKQLNKDKKYEGDLKPLIQELKIDKIEMNVHSTLESCLPCQVALRAVRQYLEEKLFPPDEAQAREAAEEEEDLRNPVKERVILRISSQQEYQKQHKPNYIYNEDLKAIQYPANGKFLTIKSDDIQAARVNEATGFMNGPFDRTSGLGESASGSANSQRVKELEKKVEALEPIIENLKAEAEEQKERADAAEEKAEEQKERADAEAAARIAAEALARQKEARTKAGIAIKMLKKGNTDIDDIADTTGLSIEEVKQLQSELASEATVNSSGIKREIDKE